LDKFNAFGGNKFRPTATATESAAATEVIGATETPDAEATEVIGATETPDAEATEAPGSDALVAPVGFCTTAIPNNPSWIVEGEVSLPDGCPETGAWAMTNNVNGLTRYGSWTEMETARNGTQATLYFEGAAASAAPASQSSPAITGTMVPVNADRVARLIQLDPIFRGGDMLQWAKAAGFTFDSLTPDARQPEEETTSTGQIVISGFQVNAVNLVAVWPSCFSTDRTVQTTSETRVHQPDLRNGSKLWTDNAPYTGPATIWGDCSNWGQLNPQ